MNINNTEEIYLDLDNPIFVIYIKDTYNESYFKETYNFFKSYKNITVWIFPGEENKIECIYAGLNIELIKNIESMFDIFKSSDSIEEFKKNLRNFKINKII